MLMEEEYYSGVERAFKEVQADIPDYAHIEEGAHKGYGCGVFCLIHLLNALIHFVNLFLHLHRPLNRLRDLHIMLYLFWR